MQIIIDIVELLQLSAILQSFFLSFGDEEEGQYLRHEREVAISNITVRELEDHKHETFLIVAAISRMFLYNNSISCICITII